MNDTNENNPLGYEKLSVLLKRFAIPSIIAMVVSSLYNIVDQIFIGQGVGYLGNAATNVAFPLTTICLAITLLISIGSASRFSLSLGEGDADRAAQAVGNALSMMVLFGILYTLCIEIFLVPLLNAFGATQDVLPYAIEYTRITAVGMPLLIITNGMSNLARADALYYVKKFTHIRLKKQHFILKPQVCLNIASLGMSNCLNQVAITFVQIVMNNSMTYYGAKTIYGSEIPLAASGIVMKTNGILLSVIIGLSQGSQPIIGFNYGAKKYDRVRGTYRLAISCNLVVSAIGFVLFQFFPKQIIALFGTGDELYFTFAVRFMRIFLFMVIVNGVQLLSSNFFAAIGKPLKGMLLSLTRQVFFLIPLLLILPLFFGMDGILFSAPIADTAAFLTTVILIRKEMNLMREQELALK